MSEKLPQFTTPVHLRSLDDEAKRKIRALLRYGDVREISKRCNFVTYNQVSNVLRGVSENDRVWKQTLEYLDGLQTTDISGRLVDLIQSEKDTEAA